MAYNSNLKLVSKFNLIAALYKKLSCLNYIPDQDEMAKCLTRLLPKGYTTRLDYPLGVDSAAEHGGTGWIITAWYEVTDPEGNASVIEYHLEGVKDEIECVNFTINNKLIRVGGGEEALSNDAGKTLLERVRKLEAVVEVAKNIIQPECEGCYNYGNCDDKTSYDCGIYKLKKFLAELEASNNG